MFRFNLIVLLLTIVSVVNCKPYPEQDNSDASSSLIPSGKERLVQLQKIIKLNNEFILSSMDLSDEEENDDDEQLVNGIFLDFSQALLKAAKRTTDRTDKFSEKLQQKANAGENLGSNEEIETIYNKIMEESAQDVIESLDKVWEDNSEVIPKDSKWIQNFIHLYSNTTFKYFNQFFKVELENSKAIDVLDLIDNDVEMLDSNDNLNTEEILKALKEKTNNKEDLESAKLFLNQLSGIFNNLKKEVNALVSSVEDDDDKK